MSDKKRLVWVVEIRRKGRWEIFHKIGYLRQAEGLAQLRRDRAWAVEDEPVRLVPYVPRRPR